MEHFANPPAEYRGAPLWSWNSKLVWADLEDQINKLQEMGMGGFTMHSRVGLDTPYLGPEFMSMVKKSTAYAREKGMKACLYDEDRWPSGAAGGLALKGHPEYRAKHLLVTARPYGSTSGHSIRASAKASRSENGVLLGKFDLEFHQDDTVSYRPSKDQHHTSNTRYIYAESNPPSEWFNGETYVDTLNPKAIAAFIRSTHEVYRTEVGEDFGGTVPTMFTDEPQHSHRGMLRHARDTADVFLPWTDDLAESFSAATGRDDLVARLPELIWDVAGREVQSRRRRWEFTHHVTERFVTATLDQMAKWCRQAGLQLTGHLMNECSLLSQTIAVGEAMRGYRNMDVPGVDMLCERVELNTVKQASSVARQQQGGPAWTMSEIYGVTNWNMTFSEHKRLGDWQAALGINRRVHHLSPVSLRGEGKRDYPAAISYQSPWFKEYRHIEDYFSRLNVALTTGHALTRVAVIHPIESFWLCFGPLRKNMPEMVERDTLFKELTEWLLYGLLDFDFIAESLIPEQAKGRSVGHAKYDVVIVPGLRTIRQTTVDFLKSFAKAGGEVVVLGDHPRLIDADEGECQVGKVVDFNRFRILRQLESHREISVVDENGVPSKTLLHQIRQDGSNRIVFISNIDRQQSIDGVISLKGEFDVGVLDAVTGEEWAVGSETETGWTSLRWRFEPAGSLLLRLSPRTDQPGSPQVDFTRYGPSGRLKLLRTTLSEPNVLLLDLAEFKINDGEWEPETEILRIGNIARQRAGLPLIGEAAAQPWSIEGSGRLPCCTVKLRFAFTAECAVDTSVDLAVEVVDGMKIAFDGKAVSTRSTSWWVDKGISRVTLGAIALGSHTIELEVPFGRLTHIERLYILGDFGVDVRGDRGVIVPARPLTWGDWVPQGLPFYAGNVTYHCTFNAEASSPTMIYIPRYAGPVVTVNIPSISLKRTVVLAGPVDLGTLPAGNYDVEVTCFGNRNNAFGNIHLAPGKTHWCGPNEFRTTDDNWIDEYDLAPMGVLYCPRIKRLGAEVSQPMLVRDRAVHGESTGGTLLTMSDSFRPGWRTDPSAEAMLRDVESDDDVEGGASPSYEVYGYAYCNSCLWWLHFRIGTTARGGP